MAKKREPKPSEQAQKTIDNTIRRDKLKKKIIKQIKSNKKAKKFFEQYNPVSISSFIESYAGRKVNWLEWGPNRVQKDINEKLRFKEAASSMLWEIQQRKLFNVQCHWRAGEIELPGIEVSWDFMRWEQKIKTCPFIDPITPEEFELYKNYMTSGSYQPRHFMSSWQGYDFFRAEHLNEGESMMPTPAWYLYYDTMMGTGNLFMLQNFKGEKEQFYLGLLKKREEEKAKKIKKKKGAKAEIPAIIKAISPNFDGKPPIIPDYKTKEEFIKKFEDKTILKYFHAMEKEDDNWHEEQALDDCLELFSYGMEDNNEMIEFKNPDDLKDSMFRAASDFEVAQITKNLDSAYDEYQLKVNTGISFSENEEMLEFADNAFNSIINFIKEQILEGRVLNGEPRDFNY